MNYSPGLGGFRTPHVDTPWECPNINMPAVPAKDLALLTFLDKETAVARATVMGTALFDNENLVAISFIGKHRSLKQDEAHIATMAERYASELRERPPMELHCTAEVEYEEPAHVTLGVKALYVATGFTIILGMASCAVLIVQSEQFDQITSIPAALFLSAISVSALVGAPLAGYSLLREEAAKARFFKLAVKLAIGLGGAWIVLITLANFLDTYILDSTGHAARGAVMEVVMAVLPVIHAAVKALIMPAQIGAEAAASVCLKIWSGRLGERSRKKIPIHDPACDVLEGMRLEHSAHGAWLAEGVAAIETVAKNLNDMRQTFIDKCIAKMNELMHRQRIASDGARFDVN